MSQDWGDRQAGKWYTPLDESNLRLNAGHKGPQGDVG